MNSRLLCCIVVLCFFVQINTQCNPYYPRMFWNPEAEEISNKNTDLIFMFNTNISCPGSYVTVSLADAIFKFRCSQKLIQTFDDTNKSQSEFISYVQTCPVLIVHPTPIASFKYTTTGAKDIVGRDNVTSDEFEVEMPVNELALNLAVISDWGPIIEKLYKPLNDTLDFILESRRRQKQQNISSEFRISGLFLNGDYAYDLQSNKCMMYLMFLNELSRVSRFWPILTSVGNHESTRAKSMYLFENSFIIGRLSTIDGNFERTQTYRFAKRATFTLFDPFLQIYKAGNQDQYQQMKGSIQKSVLKARSQFADEFMIMGSHYPVMCSQDDPHCRDAMKNMPDLYEWLSTEVEGKGLVDLYIGSHMHQYERIYPLVNNKFVLKEESPYRRGRLVSFVEAVAGVNYFIIEVDYPRLDFSVFGTHNTTGMGILTITALSNQPNYSIKYQHITTPKTYQVVDSFVIGNQFKQQTPLKPEFLRSQNDLLESI